MSKIVVIYKSKYGTTKRYAQWIAQELDAPIFDSSSIQASQLSNYDIVIYGGGLYANGIDGAKLVADNFCKTLVLFTVGLANPQITDYTPILEKAFKPEQLSKMKVFHLRGGVNYNKLSLLHRGMMAALKRKADKITPAQRTSDDVGIIETYGKEVDFTDRTAIEPLVQYVKAL